MKEKPRDIYRNMELDELIKKSQQDDRLALEELIRRNEKTVYSTLYHLDPNRTDIPDIAQEVLFRMAKGIKKLKKPATFKFWLNQIITNFFYDELRRKTRRLNTISIDAPYLNMEAGETPMALNIADTEKHPEERTLGSELDKRIREAIENLPEQFRVVVVLRELQGLSYEEIAKLTKNSIGTVKSRLSRARSRLQEDIKPYLNQERGENE